jgi:pyruvate dehydrogenase E2 component (dihydrolipoamide acetyltransferase)
MPEIKMPKLSDTMTEGTLVVWKKKKGDPVSAGEVLAEIETDKATMEWESSDDGILAEIYVQEGQRVGIGTSIAFIQAKGESLPSGPSAEGAPERKAAPAPEAAPAPAAAPAPQAVTTPIPAASQRPPTAAAAPSPAQSEGGRVKASPLAKKIAAEKGLDLSRVKGTGPGGRITERDVQLALEAPAPAPAPAPAAPAAPVAPIPAIAVNAGDVRIPLTGMRRVIAERLVQSKTTIPHFYLSAEINAGELLRLRTEVNAAALKAGGEKFTINDFILKATVAAAVKVPKVNAAFMGDSILQFASVHLSVAVSVEDGLVTPVVRDAQTKTLRELSASVKDLAARARSKKLKPEEYAGGTITVSTLGANGVDSFYAIINPPQALILSIGAIVKKPVVNEKDEIVVGHRMNIGLSCDHRVVDGAVGAEYLAELRRLLENPTLMLI